METDERISKLPELKRRIIPFGACLVAAAVCLLYARYRSDLTPWWKNFGGGVPYVVFWILFWFVAFPRRKYILPICVGVVLFTCLLEILQLWNPEPLAQFRSTRFGAALLGTTFVWNDFPPYFMGGILGLVALLGISRINNRHVE